MTRQHRSLLSLKRALESLPNLSELVLLESHDTRSLRSLEPFHRLQDLSLNASSSLVSVTLQGWPYEVLFADKELALPPRMEAFSFYPLLRSFPSFSTSNGRQFRKDFMEMLNPGAFAPCRPLIFGIPFLQRFGDPVVSRSEWDDFRDEALQNNPQVTITCTPNQGRSRPLSMKQERVLSNQQEIYGHDLSL